MSHVYYKFKSQKDPSRVVFDGPSISVFDLKREIIILNKLGTGTDFDLSIYDESTNEGKESGNGTQFNEVEYTDDNYMIPRATSVIVRRLPPSKPGKGNAAKYITGSANSTNPRNSRTENFKKANEVTAKSSTPGGLGVSKVASIPGIHANGQTTSAGEDDESSAIAMMMSAQTANWDTQQQKMAMANPVYNRSKKPLAPVPDKPPPQGYICHRCGEKGHWIQACPTNNDPNFDNKPRIKRTTGIPKVFLKRADKPIFDDDGEGKTNGVMMDADGEYVVAEPDSKSWATYKAKANAGEGDVYSQPLPAEHKDWECQICGKLAKDATRSPCCNKLFCDEDIQSALLESDFVCPGCGTTEVLLDSLQPDEQVRAQVEEYVKRKEEERRSPSPPDVKPVKTTSNAKADLKESTLSPPPSQQQSRKRSRSPSPSEDASNKKTATDHKGDTLSSLSKSPPQNTTTPAIPNHQQDPFSQQQPFNMMPMPPFMPGMPGMPGMSFPPIPPDPFMMAAMGFPPPPMPGMMPPMPPMGPMGPGMYQQQGFKPQMGNQMYGSDNSAYMRKPVNERGMRRAQRGGPNGRTQADYREVI